MKILAWNCNGAFRKKFHLLNDIQADIMVISECEDPAKGDAAYKYWAQNYLWVGGVRKGLGVFAKNHIRIEKHEWRSDGLQMFLPCNINNEFNLLAVWTKQTASRKLSYIGQLWGYLELHKDKFAALDSVICGDFNSNACWDHEHRGSNHSDVMRTLAELDLYSVYHQILGESQGEENTPTFYLHRNVQKPYHIDYAVVSNRLMDKFCEIEVGAKENWLSHSDHMPIIFSVAK